MATSKWQFSEEEIRAKLEELGYNNVPDKALKEFSNDLHCLMSSENAKEDKIASVHHRETSLTSSTFDSPATYTTTSDQSTYEANVSSDRGQRVPCRTGIHLPTSYSDNESSFEQSPVTQHRRPYVAHTSADKENKVESRHPTSTTQKRKVLRKKDGKAHVFDESFSHENATDISDVEKRLQKLPVKDDTDSESIDDEDMSDRSSVLQPWGKNRNALPSFIRPKTADLRTARGVRKTDPVNRYHQFKQEWSSNKVPGEKMHKSLRWSTREQMLQCDSFEKPRHTYVPNNYVAPTQKKRQALRWEVRSTLANI